MEEETFQSSEAVKQSLQTQVRWMDNKSSVKLKTQYKNG